MDVLTRQGNGVETVMRTIAVNAHFLLLYSPSEPPFVSRNSVKNIPTGNHYSGNGIYFGRVSYKSDTNSVIGRLTGVHCVFWASQITRDKKVGMKYSSMT